MKRTMTCNFIAFPSLKIKSFDRSNIIRSLSVQIYRNVPRFAVYSFCQVIFVDKLISGGPFQNLFSRKYRECEEEKPFILLILL